jgi:hypothetical protein
MQNEIKTGATECIFRKPSVDFDVAKSMICAKNANVIFFNIFLESRLQDRRKIGSTTDETVVKLMKRTFKFLLLCCIFPVVSTISSCHMNLSGLRLFFLLVALCPMMLFGQDSLCLSSRKYIARNSILLGLSSGGAVIYSRNPVTTERLVWSQVQLDPRIAYFPLRSLAIGATYTYGWRGGNAQDHFQWHELGAFARFYFFMKNRDRLLGADTGHPPSKVALFQKSNPTTRRFLALNIYPFAEIAWSYGNLRQQAVDRVALYSRLIVPALYLRVGFHARFLKRFYSQVSPTLACFPDQPSNLRYKFGTSIGLDFILPVKRFTQ